MKSINTYVLSEAKSPEGFVLGYVRNGIKIAKLNSDRSVYVNALQYTKGSSSDKIEVILKDGIKTHIIKSDLDIKF